MHPSKTRFFGYILKLTGSLEVVSGMRSELAASRSNRTEELGKVKNCSLQKLTVKVSVPFFMIEGVVPDKGKKPDVLLHVLNFVDLGRSNKIPLEI